MHAWDRETPFRRSPQNVNPQPNRHRQQAKADVLRNRKRRAPDRRFVGADALDQEARDRIDGDHQRRQRAVAAAERIVGQKQEAKNQGIDRAIELRRMDRLGPRKRTIDVRCESALTAPPRRTRAKPGGGARPIGLEVAR